MPPVLVASPRVASSALASLPAAGSGPALLAVVAIFRSAAMPSAARGGFLVTVVLIVAALAAPAPTPAASPVFVVPPRVAHGDRGRPRAPSQWEIINRARVSQNFGGPMMFKDSPRRAPSHTVARSGSQRTPVRDTEPYPLRSIHRRAAPLPIRSTAEFRVRGVRSHTRAVGAANGGERCPVPRVATRRRWRRTT
jgi:hypothetical protein